MPLRFESPPVLLIGTCVSFIAAVVAVYRHVGLPRLSRGLGLLSLLLFTASAAGPVWRRGDRQVVTVLVDVSASTRTATFRNRAALQHRIAEVVGNVPYRILQFADRCIPDAKSGDFHDMPCERTVYEPPVDSAVVLLFSDGRFDLPDFGPPTYPVIDPQLESPPDAAIHRLAWRDGQLILDVTNHGGPRQLSVKPAATQAIPVDRGSYSFAIKPAEGDVFAQINPADPWPENDSLSIHSSPPLQREKWWVGEGAPQGWRTFSEDSLPQAAADYLAPAIIVLNNISADAMPLAIQQRLDQYVRQLGGGLLILGGNRAFAAGDYTGTLLESLSPLASTPPKPATRWILFVDGSGSMSTSTPAGPSLWEVAARTVQQLLQRLPPYDPIALGSFAEQISWWAKSESVAQASALILPPADLSPHGPTNLQRALSDVAQSLDGSLSTEVLFITDAEAQLDHIEAIAEQLKAKNAHLRVLAIGEGSALAALRRIAEITGGSVLTATDPLAWPDRLRELSRGSIEHAQIETSIDMHYRKPLNLFGRTVMPWNRTWIKADARPLAEARFQGEAIFPAADWKRGLGQVLAAAYSPTSLEKSAMIDLISKSPRDPRFTVHWDAGPKLVVTIDAVQGKTFFNGEPFRLAISDSLSAAIPQTAPGRYQISIDAPRMPCIGTVFRGESIWDQIALPGRYAAEFESIGNDHGALAELARRTGGRVIDSRKVTPIEFHWPRRDVPLATEFAAAGAICLAAGLAWWRIK